MPTGVYPRTKQPADERFWSKVDKDGPTPGSGLGDSTQRATAGLILRLADMIAPSWPIGSVMNCKSVQSLSV